MERCNTCELWRVIASFMYMYYICLLHGVTCTYIIGLVFTQLDEFMGYVARVHLFIVTCSQSFLYFHHIMDVHKGLCTCIVT